MYNVSEIQLNVKLFRDKHCHGEELTQVLLLLFFIDYALDSFAIIYFTAICVFVY